MSPFRPTRRLAAIAIATIALLASAFVFLRPQKECRANPVGDARAERSSAGVVKAKSAPKPSSSSTSPGIPVEILVVSAEELVVPIPATGTLLPRESVTIVSELSRRLVKTHVEEGTRVEKGALLFTLDSIDLVAERDRLAVQHRLATRNAARQDDLLTQAITSEAEADAARSAEKEIEASQHVLAVTLSKTQIRAPFDGVLGLRRVSEGAWVTPSTPLITISDTSHLKIDFSIPERHAVAISTGTQFQIRVQGQAQPVVGTVKATEPGIDQASRSLLVRGELENNGKLLPGMFAKVEIEVKEDDAILLPAIAIVPGVSGRGVYVERSGRAQLAPVELGIRTPDRVQVTSGLEVGDRVIVSNLLRLRDGIAVIASNRSQSQP